MYLLLIAAALILLATFVINSTRRPPNFPPGPPWLPIVGNLPELKKLSKKLGGQHLALIELGKRYQTNVLGLKLGNSIVVATFSYPTIKKVLTGDEYDGRPDNFFIRLRSMGTRKGVTCTDGEHWAIQRNFVVRHLRDLGFGRKQMELMVKEELEQIQKIIGESGNEIQVGRLLSPSVINVIWALLTGSRLSRKDARLERFLELMTLRSKHFDMSGGILNLFPWLRYIAPEKTGYSVIQQLNEELKKFFMEIINEHYENWYEGRNDDLIYSFITEMKMEDSNYTFTYEQLIMVCLDLFIAGSETTSNTIAFAFLMMILHPDIQIKVHNCLDNTLEKDKTLDYSDRHRLPYVEAVLLETLRYCHVTPITGPRRVLKDTTLEGYSIPKETTVLMSCHSIHRDENYWGDPDNFRPERFLDNEGKLVHHDRLIPFGLGRRRCLGEVLSRNCIFMFFAGILKDYTISLMPGAPTPTGVPLPGITLSPEKYTARFIKRH